MRRRTAGLPEEIDLVALAEGIPLSVFVLDRHGNMLYTNRRWIEYSGMRLDVTLGQGVLATIHPDDAEYAIADWKGALSAGRAYTNHYRVRRADGTYRRHDTTAIPVRGLDGSIHCWIGTLAEADDAPLSVVLGGTSRWTFDSSDALASSAVRSAFVARLRESGAPDADYPGAELIFAELAGNVVRYAPGPVDVEIGWENGDAVLHVIDRGEAFEPHIGLPDDVYSENGRGLFIVATFGRDFSVERIDGGNHVRVTLPVRRAAD